MKFTLLPDESVSDRVARIAREALADGPMGAYIRGDDYASFLSIWGREQELRFIHTSCAVFCSAVLGYAGFPLHKPWNGLGEWGIEGDHNAWLQPLSLTHPAWVKPTGNNEPGIGDIILRGMSHVEMVVEKLPTGLWRCAAGGGSPEGHEVDGLTASQIHMTNGTLCRMTPPHGKDIFAPDGNGRRPTGWWDVSQIGLPDYADVIEQLREANQ